MLLETCGDFMPASDPRQRACSLARTSTQCRMQEPTTVFLEWFWQRL